LPFTSNGGVRLHYEVFGKGEPLFLHIGAGGEWDFWKVYGYLEKLKGYRLIINDPRGRGQSERPGTLAAHRMERYVDDVIAILDDLGIEKTAFWGHSDGARIGYVLALKHPERVSALIAMGGQDLPDEYKIWRIDFAAQAKKEGMGFIDDLFTKSAGKDFPPWFKKVERNRDVKMLELEMLAWKPWIYNMGMYNKIRVPTLVLTGETEDPQKVAPEIAKRLPDGKLVILKGLDHVDAFTHSDASIPVATSFLREIGRRKRHK
jgi:pimeloyl-ACP methyl ester carboxylesterase